MPARRLRPKCRYVFTLIALALLMRSGAATQPSVSQVNLTGAVSKTVTLSVPPGFTDRNVAVISSSHTLRITLSGDDTQPTVIRVPLLVRSNSSFKITAGFESQTAQLNQLSVVEKRATGKLVAAQALNAIESHVPLDPDTSRPLLVLTGPRVSTGGTLQSSSNALQVTLLILLQPRPSPGWLAHLTLVATAE